MVPYNTKKNCHSIYEVLLSTSFLKKLKRYRENSVKHKVVEPVQALKHYEFTIYFFLCENVTRNFKKDLK